MLQQERASRAVGDVSAGQQECDWTTIDVGQRMDFRGSCAARATDRLIVFSSLTPDAQRCALTAELSIRTCAGGPPAEASAWKMSTHTPFADQRTKRL